MLRLCLIALFLMFVVANLAVAAMAESKKEILTFFGTYTSGRSKGIYSYKFDTGNGTLTPLHETEGIKNPSFLAIHPNHKFLFAVSEVDGGGGKKDGSVWAFKIGENGVLTAINHQPSGGNGPCYVALDHLGKFALVANYSDGTVASLPINEDGSLKSAVSVIQQEGSSVDPKRQAGPHAHSINLSPDDRFAIACDLGADKIIVYKLNPKGKLSLSSFCQAHPGAGPRHTAFSSDGRFVYVANELSSSVGVYGFDAKKGLLTELQMIGAVPHPDMKNTLAEIQIHPNGKLLFCSVRGEDCLSVYTIDQQTGRLAPAAHQNTVGETPRNFCIDPTGNFLIVCNQGSNNVVIFRIDQESGHLLQIDQPKPLPEPVCVKFMKSD